MSDDPTATAAWTCCGVTYKGGTECPKCLTPKPDTAAGRTYRAEVVVMTSKTTLTLREGEQAFYKHTEYDGQFGARHVFVVLREVTDD